MRRATSLRLLLLLLVLTGVAAMHTIGHPSTGHVTSGHSTLSMGAGALIEPVRDVTQQRADDPDNRMVMNPLNVCVAVLVAGMLLLLAAMLGQLRFTRRSGSGAVPLRVRAGRGPPTSLLFGLTLADLSVLRT